MLFDSEVIHNKLHYLDTILTNTNLLERVVSKHLTGEVIIKHLPRVWEPGGGSTLFCLESQAGKYLLKVKSSAVWVESLLESELNSLHKPSLSNEHEFLLYLNRVGVPWVPRLFFFEEADGLHFLATEWLGSFSESAINMSATNLLNSWEDLQNAVLFLFENGIAHTDIHEHNVCFRNDQIVIIDFEEARFIRQELPFKESLDVAGINHYGNVGEFPLINGGVAGFTCLNRLKQVFQSIVKENLPRLLSACNFDQNCPYNLDALQEPDSRIYQSIQIDDLKIAGQRPVFDSRLQLLTFLFNRIGSKNKPIKHLDVGSNMGVFCFTLSNIPCVIQSIGVEASHDYVEAANSLAFAYNFKKTEFHKIHCGEESLLKVASGTNVITMFSVYHHIASKDSFLSDLQQLNADYLIAEFATQERYYLERGNLNSEIEYIRSRLGFSSAQQLSVSEDYARPIVVFSRQPLDSITQTICSWISSNNTKWKILKSVRHPKSSILLLANRFVSRLRQSTVSPDFSPVNLLEKYDLLVAWIDGNSQQGGGILEYGKSVKSYPEVTGYYIPTLLNWGKRDRAIGYARWLLTVQNYDGSWSDPYGKSPYTFDTGQILKGLMAVLPMYPEVASSIRRGCDWLLTQITSTGRMVTPDKSAWGLPNGNMVSENIHLYALEPLRSAGKHFNEPRYLDAVDLVLSHYLALPDLTDFNTLSHFHAYVLEALVDLGYPELAITAMLKIEKIQRPDGSVPAYPDVDWVCSTGLAQYAVIWYKLGVCEPAQKAFNFLCRLQNSSGGFYGSYGCGADYFPDKEISWTVKYFLDAFWLKISTSFEGEAGIFPKYIEDSDGRYRLVSQTVRHAVPHTILEAGCGKGRYLQRLNEEFPDIQLYGLDISKQMLTTLPENIHQVYGSLLNIPVADSSFELVYCIEALEHAVNISGAIRELGRIVSPGGTLVIVDKNITCCGRLKIAEWEQWFDTEEVKNILQQNAFTVQVVQNLSYDGCDGSDGLFTGWVAIKN